MIGHTKNYVKVIIRDVDKTLLGACVKVRIVETSKWHAVGVIIDTKNVIGEILPVESYKKTYKKTKVDFKAKERLEKLREELNMNKGAKTSVNTENDTKTKVDWTKIIIIIGAIMVIIGAIFIYMGK